MELQVVVPNGRTGGGKISVADTVFQQAYNEDLVHQVVNAYRAGMRQGSKAQKSRSDVRGGGKKPWKQKGTGRARAGTIRSPIWVGGGVTFAARPRNFSQKINKKMSKLAMRCIFSELIRQKRLVVIENIVAETPKTKKFVKQLNEMNLPEVLIITDEVNENLYFASRNIPKVEVIDIKSVDPLNLLYFPKVAVTSAAMKQIEERLA